jgi:UDP-N-acetylglucosamine 2-epimerase
VKIATVVGARPQFVKAAVVSRVLRQAHADTVIHTGQHYDDAMSAAFFRDLEIPEADVNLGVGSAAHGAMTGEMLRRLEPILERERPDGIVVYGDTNSTLAGALVAAKLVYADGSRPFLAHVEAGLRSFNRSMPEERNRVVTDHLADLLLAPSAAAIANLASEGLAQRAVDVGDVMVDAFRWAQARGDGHLPEAARLRPGYMLLTLHRAENVDDPRRLAAWLAALDGDHQIVFPVHPRTDAAMRAAGLRAPANVETIAPVGYLAMVALEARARAVLTDSGGVQKEAYLAGVPCITLRGETEWVETVATGWNRLVRSPGELVDALAEEAAFDRARERPPLYGDGRAAERVVAALERHHASTDPGGAVPLRAGSRR